MTTLLKTVLAVFIFSPILFFLLVFTISRFRREHLLKSVQTAADLSTFFFVLAVHFLIVTIWDKHWLFPVFTVVFVLITAFLFIHRFLRGTMNYSRVIKFLWRSCFLFFFLLYVILFTAGIIVYVTNSMST
ncbi:MAG: DUF3397 domain-containing protein [Caldibacillus sp.]